MNVLPLQRELNCLKGPSVLLIALTLTGCGGLGTKPEFHSAAVEPTKFVISYSPSYLIGIEKANRTRIGGPQWKDCDRKEYCFNTNTPELTTELRQKIEERFDDIKGHFISHIIRYAHQGNGWYAGQWSYNIYGPENQDQTRTCATQGQTPTETCSNSGWNAVRNLKSELAQRIKQDGITHLIVMSTGWNTLQNESISNYNDWIAHILSAAREDGTIRFRPLFIGLSWASDWLWWNWFGASDFVNKAHDADEVGLTWANVLVHEVLLPLKQDTGVPVVLIGHSFGARLLSRAIYSGAILPSKSTSREPVDLFIGMQGAFSVNRFTPDKGKEAQPYRNYSRGAKKILLTSSKYDEAVESAIHTGDTFAGSAHAYQITQGKDYAGIFEHIAIDPQGGWTTPPSSNSSKVTLVEASAMIATNKPGTGGLAHSDVFDKEAGRFMWQAIKEFSINTSGH